MDAHRKFWNDQQQALQRALAHPAEHSKAIELFLNQHAMVHSTAMSGSKAWSFEDEVWQGLTETQARCIPPKLEHSIAWVIWHIARIEDVTMNLLVAGTPQVFNQDHWLQRMNAPIRHTGNVMDNQGMAELSAALDLDALRAYRAAVGRRTREIVQALEPHELKQKIEPARLQQIWNEGAVLEAAREIVDYWSRRTKAGLLLMPPTRHNFLHLNEATRIKQKCR